MTDRIARFLFASEPKERKENTRRDMLLAVLLASPFALAVISPVVNMGHAMLATFFLFMIPALRPMNSRWPWITFLVIAVPSLMMGDNYGRLKITGSPFLLGCHRAYEIVLRRDLWEPQGKGLKRFDLFRNSHMDNLKVWFASHNVQQLHRRVVVTFDGKWEMTKPATFERFGTTYNVPQSNGGERVTCVFEPATGFDRPYFFTSITVNGELHDDSWLGACVDSRTDETGQSECPEYAP